MPSSRCERDFFMTDQDQPNTQEHHEEITRLVSVARTDGQPEKRTDGRSAPRFAVGMRLDVTTDPDVEQCAWPATMHNISDSGFAFWSRRQLRNGGEIWVREFSGDNSSPWLPAHVTHCTVGIKGYLVGAAFDVADQAV